MLSDRADNLANDLTKIRSKQDRKPKNTPD